MRRAERCCSRTSRCSSPTTRSQLRQVVNSMQTLAADMPSKNWLRDDLRAMAVENSRASGRDVDKIDCFMSVLQGIGPQAACCRRRRPVARTIARTCCRKHARARACARARPNAHCPRPHTRPHKGDRGSRSGGRMLSGGASRAAEQRREPAATPASRICLRLITRGREPRCGSAGESDACVWQPAADDAANGGR